MAGIFSKIMCEILAPAGSKENLISAVSAGADAVYLGLTDFSARKTAENFTLDNLKFAVAYAKTFGVKVYVTVNTLIKDCEVDRLLNDINIAYSYGVDAFILQDVFLGEYVKKIMPDITLHLSTQAGVCNVYGAKLAKKCGFSRVILARETKVEDIKAIAEIIETEVFIQGALCTCFSGHCYFSSFIGGNSGNRGLCKQPCRKEYSIERNGEKLKEGYLISLSDLSVRKDISYLKSLGVKSFKIEGRLRSKEYVYSAVKYYRELLNGNDDINLYNALKVAFNRGNYTKGLAFGQEKDFISDKIQNNVGLFVGKVKKTYKDEIFVDLNFDLTEGDSFKIIRNGFEVGNATVINVDGKLKIKFKGNVFVGDSVHLTKKSDLYNLLRVGELKKDIVVDVYLKCGEKLKFSCGDVEVESDTEVDKALNSPISRQDVILCLNKTDIYPYNVKTNFISFDENCFVVKSLLNKLRVALYDKLFYGKIFKNAYNIAKYEINYNSVIPFENANTVIVSNDKISLAGYLDVIYFPYNYSNVSLLNTDKRVWLYLPAYLSGKDLEIIDKIVDKFYGVYGDGVWALEYAKAKGLRLFAGVGCNVFNKIDVSYLINNEVTNVAVSKELSLNEIKSLNYPVFVLNNGLIEVMDLIYCPFSKNCKKCDINEEFLLKDKENREFKVKKYIISECRFKVYNNATLISVNGVNSIEDKSLKLPSITTSGNLKKGIK